MTEALAMAMRTTVAITLLLGAACGPARAGAPDVKPVPSAAPASTDAAAAASPTPAPVVTPGAVAEGRTPIAAHKDRMRWIEGPPALKNSRMTVLEGSPKQPGMYTMRLSVQAGSKVPLHTHPQDERVTVLEGKVTVVLGEDPSGKGDTYGAGDFYLTPAGTPHSVTFDEKSVVQITGIGPWEVVPFSK